jgi:hypothetical protein
MMPYGERVDATVPDDKSIYTGVELGVSARFGTSGQSLAADRSGRR